MRLTNHTDIPTPLVRDVLRFVMPNGVTNVRVTIYNTARRWAGGRGGSGYVSARIPKAERYPALPSHGAYLGWPPHTRIEALVLLLAHELRHCWQTVNPRGYRVWGARGQYSERDADAYAIQKLRAWRREH